MDFLLDAEEALSAAKQELPNRRWRTAFFKVLNCRASAISSVPTASFFVWYCCETLLRSLNLISLVYSERGDFAGWQDTKVVWEVLALTRVDSLCVKWGLYNYWVFSYAALSVTSVSVLLLLVYQQYKFGHYNTPIARYCFLLPTWLLARLLYIPVLCTSAALLKYSILSPRDMPEYHNYPSTVLSMDSFGPYFSFLGPISLLFGFIEALFLFEVSLSPTIQQHGACVHSGLRIIERLLSAILVVLHFSLQDIHWVAYKSLFFLLTSLMTGLFLWYLPYYYRFFTYIQAARYASAALASMCFILGLFLNNAAVTLSLFFVLILPVLFFLRYGMEKRIDLFAQIDQKNHRISGIFEKELFLRWKISKISPSDKPAISSILLEFADFVSTSRKHKIIVIWETHFCLDFMKDERLSRIKLAKALHCESTIWEDFQEFQLRELLNTENCTYHEEVDFVHYQTLLQQAKKYDEQFCFLLLSFWSEVSSRALVWSRMERLINRIDITLKELKHFYEDLTKKYPKSPSGLRLFGTFLRDLCNERQKAEKVLRKAETELQVQLRAAKGEQNFQRFTYFNEANGLLIVSGAQKSFGTVTFANLEAANTLGYPSVAALVGVDVNQLVPPPFYHNHHDHMRNFLNKCSSPIIELPFTVFMRKLNGNIVEVYTSMKCTALNGHPFFIVALRNRGNNREIALISPEKRIYVHTDGFPEAILSDYSDLKGKPLDEVIPFISEIACAKRLFCPFKAQSLYGKRLHLMLGRSTINRVNIDLLMVFTEKSEFVRWKLDPQGCALSELTYSAEDVCPVVSLLAESQAEASMSPSGSIIVRQQTKHLSYAPIFSKTAQEKVDSTTKIEANSQETGLNASSFQTILTTFYARKAGSSSKTDRLLLHKAHKALQLLAVVLLGLTVLLVAFSLSVLAYLIVYVNGQESDYVVMHFLEAPYDLISLSNLSRETTEVRSWPEVVTDMQNRTSELELLRNILVDGDNHLAVFLQRERRQFDTWSQRDSTYYTLERSVEEFLGDYIHQAILLAQSSSPPSLSSPSLFYIYRNGLSEALSAVNASLTAYIDHEVEDIVAFQRQLLVLSCLFIALFVLSCCLLVPVVFSIQRALLGVWAFFFDMQLAQVLEAKAKCIDRLEREHGHDLSLSFGTHNLHPQFTERLKAKLQIRLPKEWFILAWKLALLFTISISFYIGVDLLGSQGVGDTQMDYLHTAKEAMSVRALMLLGDLWIKEAWTSERYVDIVASGQKRLSPDIELERVFSEAQIRRARLFGQFIRKGKDQYPCEFTSPEFASGLHSSESLTLCDLISLQTTDQRALLTHNSAIIASTGLCQFAQIKSLETEKTEELSRIKQVVAGITAGYCIVVTLLYICLYRPSLHAISRRVKKVWKLSQLIVSRY